MNINEMMGEFEAGVIAAEGLTTQLVAMMEEDEGRELTEFERKCIATGAFAGWTMRHRYDEWEMTEKIKNN